MTKSNIEKRLNSLQFLRGKAHALLEARFPDRRLRYNWLIRNSRNVHMSQLQREELGVLIQKLQTLK